MTKDNQQQSYRKLLTTPMENEQTSMVVQWLRLHAPNVGGPGSIPVQDLTSTKKILQTSTKIEDTTYLN